MDFSVNGTLAGTAESEVRLAKPGRVKVSVKAAANLDVQPNDDDPAAALRREARTGISNARASATSREVPVEIIVNGERVAAQNLVADGTGEDADVRRRDRREQLGRGSRAAVVAHESRVRRWSTANRSARHGEARNGA